LSAEAVSANTNALAKVGTIILSNFPRSRSQMKRREMIDEDCSW
jgi:hypothetical protein